MINAAKLIYLLKEQRKAMGYSQEFMAYSLGISQSKLSRIERGSGNITLDELSAMMDCLQMEFVDLIPGRIEIDKLKIKIAELNTELEKKEYALNRLFRELLQTREQNHELLRLLSRFSMPLLSRRNFQDKNP